MYLSLSLSVSLYLSLSLSFFGSGHVSSSLWSNVSEVTSLWDCSLVEFPKCICLCHCLCLRIYLCHCFFLGQVMSPHHSDQISQRSQVSGVALWWSSLNVLSLSLSLYLSLSLSLSFLWSGHVSSSLWSNVSKVTRVTSFQGHSLLFESDGHTDGHW